MAIEKHIGKRIKALRKSRGITQEELATLAELDRGYLSEVENGYKNFSIQTLDKIADALKTSIASLVADEDDSPGNK